MSTLEKNIIAFSRKKDIDLAIQRFDLFLEETKDFESSSDRVRNFALSLIMISISEMSVYLSIKKIISEKFKEQKLANNFCNSLIFLAVTCKAAEDDFLRLFFENYQSFINEKWVECFAATWILRDEHFRKIIVSLCNKKYIESNNESWRLLSKNLEKVRRISQEKNINEFSPKVTKRKLKVAVCISGQLRGYEKALESWKGLFSDESIQFDIFVHSWVNIGFALPIGEKANRWFSPEEMIKFRDLSFFYKNGVENRFPGFYSFLKKIGVTSEEKVAKAVGAKKVVLEDDLSDTYKNFSNPKKMYYKIYAAHLLAKNTDSYDLYLRIRPDLILQEKEIDYHEILSRSSRDRAVFTGSDFYYAYYGFGVDDKAAIGTCDVMDIYSTTFQFSENAQIPFVGHCSLATNLMTHDVSAYHSEAINGKGFSNPNIMDYVKNDSELSKNISMALDEDYNSSYITDFDKELYLLLKSKIRA